MFPDLIVWYGGYYALSWRLQDEFCKGVFEKFRNTKRPKFKNTIHTNSGEVQVKF